MKRRFFNAPKISIFDRLLLVVACIFALGISNLKLAANVFKEPLLNYAEKLVIKLSTLVINQAVLEEIKYNFNSDAIMKTSLDDQGLIVALDFDTYLLNNIATSTTNNAYKYLSYIEQGRIQEVDNNIIDVIKEYDLKHGIVQEIPLGIVANNPLINYLGPDIPVKFSLAGDLTSNLTSEISEYGINNALIKVILNVSVSLDVIIPLAKKGSNVYTSIPLAMKMIQGEIPQAYLGVNKII